MKQAEPKCRSAWTRRNASLLIKVGRVTPGAPNRVIAKAARRGLTRPTAAGSWFQCAAAVMLLGYVTAFAQTDYLGETPPGDEPQVFGRGMVSVDGKNTHALQLSPDGRMLIFSRYPDRTSFRLVRTEKGWSQPVKTSFTGKEVSFDAASKRLFYYDQGDLFSVRYTEDGFSEATRLNSKINTAEAEYYPCISARGNLFFSRNSRWDQGRIMMAKPDGSDFAEPVDLGDLVNAGGAAHGFVAPDESYLLFNSPRAGSFTKNDLWISFRKEDGAWTAPVNLGKRINRDAMAVLCPTVSRDGKYLFFTRLQEGGTGYVYWVGTKVIEDARQDQTTKPAL